MGNTYGVWILYGGLLSLKFFNADDQTSAAERHGTVKGNTELNQTRYFMDVLTLKCNSENVSCWGRGYASVSTANERLASFKFNIHHI